MLTSIESLQRSRCAKSIGLALALTVVARPAAAVCGDSDPPPPPGNEDGTVRICELALNRFALSLLPLSHTVDFTFNISVPNPFLLPPTINIPMSGTASANVNTLNFDIDAGGVSVTALVSGDIMGVPFVTSLTASVLVTLDSVRETLRFQPLALLAFPTVQFGVITVPLPFALDLGPSITIPPVPLGAVLMQVETADGQREFLLDASEHSLTRHDGYLELRANVQIK